MPASKGSAPVRGGRKPIPTKLKELNGNPGLRPLNVDPPTTPGAPPPPRWLVGVELAYYYEMVPLLLDMKVLTMSDGDDLAAYCHLREQWLCMIEEMETMGGHMVKGFRGMKVNPLLTQFFKLTGLVDQYRAHFGLNPSSRSRISLPKKEPGEGLDELRALRDRKRATS